MQHSIIIPSTLGGFANTRTEKVSTATGREMYLLYGSLEETAAERVCPICGSQMHANDQSEVDLRHPKFPLTHNDAFPMGGSTSMSR